MVLPLFEMMNKSIKNRFSWACLYVIIFLPDDLSNLQNHEKVADFHRNVKSLLFTLDGWIWYQSKVHDPNESFFCMTP